MLCHWHRMHIKIFEQLQKAKRHCYAKNLKINERFVRPWQALKGISIKNIYIRQLSYPTLQKYIYLKGLSNKKFSCMLCHWHRKHESRRLKIRISSRIYEAEFKKTLTRESGAQMGLFDEKTQGRTSHDTVPLSLAWVVLYVCRVCCTSDESYHWDVVRPLMSLLLSLNAVEK
jgi:hypothetical protein